MSLGLNKKYRIRNLLEKEEYVDPITFQKIKEEETLLNLFYEANITLIPKPDKTEHTFTKRLTISFTNLDGKLLNKIPPNNVWKTHTHTHTHPTAKCDLF